MAGQFRIGHGYDVHQLVEGRRCIIGGVEIESKLGLLGHSDADVLSHAIADSILGAAALPDIGYYFPPSDDSCKDIDSQEIVKRAVAEIRKLGYKVSNVDASIIAETPKMLPHVPAMKKFSQTRLASNRPTSESRRRPTKRWAGKGAKRESARTRFASSSASTKKLRYKNADRNADALRFFYCEARSFSV